MNIEEHIARLEEDVTLLQEAYAALRELFEDECASVYKYRAWKRLDEKLNQGVDKRDEL